MIWEILEELNEGFRAYVSVFQPFWGRGTQNDKKKFAKPKWPSKILADPQLFQFNWEYLSNLI